MEKTPRIVFRFFLNTILGVFSSKLLPMVLAGARTMNLRSLTRTSYQWDYKAHQKSSHIPCVYERHLDPCEQCSDSIIRW